MSATRNRLKDDTVMKIDSRSLKYTPMVLIVLDGWGYSEDPKCNAIYAARKPTWDFLWQRYPHTLIEGSGLKVGLPSEQMGNSEVGHLNLGAGRVVYQEYTRIGQAIVEGKFARNEVFLRALDQAAANSKAVHVLGLLSPGGVHSHEEHIHALARLAQTRGVHNLNIHAFLDGRDTPPMSAGTSITAMEAVLRESGNGRIASIVGRYYAMDRDKRWHRTQAAYDMLTTGRADYQCPNAMAALEMAYARGETDEFVKPTVIGPEGAVGHHVRDGDVVIFMNFRADRARQITQAFIDPGFDGFSRVVTPRLGAFVCLTEYSKSFDVPVAYPPTRLKNVLGEYVASLGLRQLRIAETEKYAHVTFFFNGGVEQSFAGEDRILVPSPKVATYDLQPEMSAPELTDKLVEAIRSGVYQLVICNYANADMVGHTGNMEAAIDAIEALDGCLGRVYEALRDVGGEMLITADHGNAERMCDDATAQAHTAHTSNPVPLIYVGRPASLKDDGALSDVAPTLLYLLGIDKPGEMVGESLVCLKSP